MNAPRTALVHQQSHRRVPFPHSNMSGLQLGSLRDRDDDGHLLSPSSDAKRRRINDGPRSYTSALSYDQSNRMMRPHDSSIAYPEDRPHDNRELPGPESLRSHNGTMEPPPRPGHQSPFPGRSSPFDESLRLPPLQTQMPGPLHRAEIHAQGQSQARSVEAMVMTIPYINKIKVLSKISPPLAAPGPTSPAQETRGCLIVVEGADVKFTSEVGEYLKDYIRKDGECALQTWNSEPKAKDDAEMTGVDTLSSANANPFLRYLDEIRFWHQKSQDIIKFMTTLPTSSSAPGGEQPTLQDTTAETDQKPLKAVIPVALLPAGFSLSLSDYHASAIPINDAYAPVDHWQWMATLWRGIVGPDLTIFVKILPPDRESKEEMARFGGVEVRGDCKAIVVRVLTDEGGEEGKRLEDKMLRRLGFEVMEFVRGIGGEAEARTAFSRS